MPIPQLIGFAGWPRVGKDTCANALVGYGGSVSHVVGFADGVREALELLDPLVRFQRVVQYGDAYQEDFMSLSVLLEEGRLAGDKSGGWEFAKFYYPESRGLMQRMGGEVGRGMFGENTWVDILFRRILPLLDRDHHVYVKDVRYPNEVERIRSHNGVLVWVQNLDKVPRAPSQHSSDTSIGPEDCDLIFNNTGPLDEIRGQLITLLNGEARWARVPTPTGGTP